MGSIPPRFMIHEITVEPPAGESSRGPLYGMPTTVKCLLDEQTRAVRTPGGEQVTSTSTAYAGLGENVPPLSRVTLPDGRVTKVIQTKRRDGKKLGTPNHLEIQLE
ncbi:MULTISPECIES: hypothetical protein [Streptomyces]|uniref:hypothetical protein n=1 Tax=Streptomyces TaxID=1883 RepID=UPI0007661914|nr:MULTISPECIES: hypothetical protein [Streptomyces]MBE4783909.1 hypothetical protein [Streptomyces caniscabiei]MBE4791592.1 hypothetical protein [Streptomyces caniscabiei]MDX3009171.1 hypothetical protein [Streptomyces caniscabiei]MDX3831394.1 hypothetical protein [Streptomyces europaeiscabiei]